MQQLQGKIEQAIRAIEGWRSPFNLKINKAKSEILTREADLEVGGVKCVKTVKYLGLRIELDRLAQKKSAVAQIQKNLNHLKWKLRDADPEVKEQLTCCLARSLLIYMGTPMVAAKVWNGGDIDSEEIRLYRRIYHVPNTISNRAIQHITTQIRPARGVVERLASKAWHMFKR